MDTHLDEIRLFIALPLRITPRLAALVERLSATGRAVRPVREEQMHLTLKFLGDVAAERSSDIQAVLDDVARSTSPFEWSIQGLGAFPTSKRPRVVWAGCVPEEPLIALARSIEDGLAAHGFERERGGFKPHLTLARVRGPVPGELQEMLETPDAATLAQEHARTVVLYQSILERSGAIHQVIHEAQFSGS